MTQVQRVALAARTFTVAALLAMAVVIGQRSIVNGVLAVTLVAVLAQAASLSRLLPEAWLGLIEGVAIAGLAVAMAPGNDSVVPYLAIPVLIGGLAGRVWGLARAACAEAVVMTAGMLLAHDVDRLLAARGLIWVVTGIGLGFLGASIHRLLAESVTETSYRNALDLIKQLHNLSGQLTDGLDVAAIADRLLAATAESLSLRAAAVFARTSTGVITPLRYATGSDPDDFPDGIARAEAAWVGGTSILQGQDLTVPLTRDDETVAVLLARCASIPAPEDVAALSDTLSAEILKLYAAVLFEEVRSSATQAERQRLAREVHDGIAQDVASLGYLLDGIVAADPDQDRQLRQLRLETTRVVSELRHSVFDLRNEVGAGRALGESLTEMTRHVGNHTTMAVHLSLDEAGPRLRAKVEAELLRIAQEAVTNARKHSGADNLWLSCRVRAPAAEIVIRDDGSGLGAGRDDSHGLLIMEERATSVGADLEITSPAAEGHGTRVAVRVAG